MSKKKKQHDDEHVDETWLLPYSDMLTLLLALFIVMFAMSNVDKAKLQKVSEQFSVIFSGGGDALSEGGKTAIPMEESGGNKVEQDTMERIKSTLEAEIKEKGYENKVNTSLNEEGLQISIQDAVLFDSGKARILKGVRPLLLDISKMIKNLDNDIRFAGHTDNVPIDNSEYRSNWELSAVRAINVMNYMVDRGKIKASRSSIQAYGEYKPKYSNATEAGRAKNRRVEIFIVRKYPLTDKKNK
ncbi:flagellar motor protein MotB [Clostridium oryzae]|uniref:Motility protein B n=1 Tax=Clostridium oryzae TaxID=1450648 RepID=A0A1V4ISL9_9CLOT|nr:flagellar motor protein MotB [Clostridium oryzae]OPJ62916.1 motility protein B [Clostridium oryzae]